MKKSLLAFCLLLVSGFWAIGQTSSSATAVNFTSNDCAGVSHTLFTELDAGQVIVLCWVMPCPSCVAPATAASSEAQKFATSNPGKVKFYLTYDAANTSCTSLTSWANTNKITPDAKFANTGGVIKMTDYGSSGMNKVVVLGGTSHTVYYTGTGSASASAIHAAITNALASATGVIENNNTDMGLNLFPNPVMNEAKIHYTLNKAADVKVEVLNVVGEKVADVSLGMQAAGKQEYQINFASLSKGVYFVKLNDGESIETIKMFVTH